MHTHRHRHCYKNFKLEKIGQNKQDDDTFTKDDRWSLRVRQSPQKVPKLIMRSQTILVLLII